MIKDINDFIFHDVATKAMVMSLINDPDLFPAERKGILFYGDYGVGKTTLSRLLPDEIDKARGAMAPTGLDLEIDCCDTTYRSQIAKVNKVLNTHGSFRHGEIKYFLFDEFDNYGKHQKQFKNLTSHKQIGFFITTNNLSSICPSIQNRCYLIELKQPPFQVWQNYGANMFAQRKLSVTQHEIDTAIKSARTNSIRDVVTALKVLAHQKGSTQTAKAA